MCPVTLLLRSQALFHVPVWPYWNPWHLHSPRCHSSALSPRVRPFSPTLSQEPRGPQLSAYESEPPEEFSEEKHPETEAQAISHP